MIAEGFAKNAAITANATATSTGSIALESVANSMPTFLGVPWQNFAEPVVTFNFLALTVFSSLFGYLIWNKVLKQLGTVLASNYIYGIPLVTIITAVIALGERITAMAIAGTMTIIAGMIMAEWKKK